MARSVGIMAYGTQEDRIRLEALARLEGQSSSQWMIQKIRAAYVEIYGSTDPSKVVQSDEQKDLFHDRP